MRTRLVIPAVEADRETSKWAGTRPVKAPVVAILLATATLLTAGCSLSLSPLSKHANAFSVATTGIVDTSEDAYRAANRLHREEQEAKAVQAFDNQPGWSPYAHLEPLLTPEQMEARIKVLDGLKAYSAALVEITDGKKHMDKLGHEEAAGSDLKGLSAAAELAKLFPNANATETKIAQTAVFALGDFLLRRKVRQKLPAVTTEMNPTVQSLCRLIGDDVKVLRSQADVDYQTMITDENQAILHEHSDPNLRRAQIARLIDLASRQRDNDALLGKLHDALTALALTHQALAGAAQGNDPESIRQQITNLVSAGQELGNYYKSL